MKNIFKSTAALLIAATTLTSCLKDDTMVLDPDKAGGNIIEFANPGDINVPGSTTALYVKSYPIVTTPTVIPIEVAYSGAEDSAPQDITVNLSLGTQAVVDQYNTEQHTTYEIMPNTMYTFNTTSVVIPKGAKRASFNITVQTNLFDLAKAYVIPLKITGASYGTVSANFSNILLNVGAKNAVDGLYGYKTSATTSLQPNANKKDVPLVTTGANTVKTNLLDFYSNIITYNIDFTTNKVTVVSVVSSIGTPITDPSSNWNPATKVMYVKWTAGTRSFEETYTYQGVR